MSTNFFKSVYFKDFRNAARFSPGSNPPRLKFNGFLGMNFNPEVATLTGIENNVKFMNHISSLVKTADIPSVTFEHDVKNQYNKRKVVYKKVSYSDLKISVYDTLDSAWVIMLMRYFSHYSMNPVNKFDVAGNPVFKSNSLLGKPVPGGDGSGGAEFNSNEMGMNIMREDLKSFFTHLDVVQYHGGRAVQYTVFNPYITDFQIDGFDHAASEIVNINITFAFENFAMRPQVNFVISEDDLDRFDRDFGYTSSSLLGFQNPLEDLFRSFVFRDVPAELNIPEDGRRMLFLTPQIPDGEGDQQSSDIQRSLQPLFTGFGTPPEPPPAPPQGNAADAVPGVSTPNNVNPVTDTPVSPVDAPSTDSTGQGGQVA